MPNGAKFSDIIERILKMQLGFPTLSAFLRNAIYPVRPGEFSPALTRCALPKPIFRANSRPRRRGVLW